MSAPPDLAVAAAPAPGSPAASLIYAGTAGGVGRIVLVNTALNLLTLGFYRFWGKTRLRRYLWRNISFQGDALEYTGLPRELLFGFLIALGVLLPLVILAGLLELAPLTWNEVGQDALSIVLLFLFHFAFFRARRYRLTRTTWRGIRGGQTGSAAKYALIAFVQVVVLLLSLGLSRPLLSTTLQRFRLANSWFGDRCFSFDGRARDLFARWLLAWLLLMPTLGLAYVWYRAAELRYFAEHTAYEDLRFELPVRGHELLGIYAVYVLALIAVGLTVLGLGLVMQGVSIVFGLDANASLVDLGMSMAPLAAVIGLFIAVSILHPILVTHRLTRLLAAKLSIIGEQDFAAIAQSSREIPGRGEGLADALDVGSV